MTTTRYFSLGRHAMKEALRHAGVSSGDFVLIPSFICRDLLSAVAELEAKVIFYEIDKLLKPIDLARAKNAKVVVAVNYFGFAQDLAPFNEYCQQSGAILIEDNAHGFLSRDENNNLLGTRAKFGITSFRKSLHVPNGAILNSSSDNSDIDNQLDFDKSPVAKRNIVLGVFVKIESRTNIPIVAIGQSISRMLRFARTGSGLPRPDPDAETKIPGSANPHYQSVKVLEALDENREISRRRNLYLKLQPQVVKTGATPVFKELPINTCPYGFPVYATTATMHRLMQVARKNRVTLMSWPDLPSDIKKTAPDHYKQVWLLNFK